jgi:hypothetical protein
MNIVATMCFPPNGERKEFIFDVADDIGPHWEDLMTCGARVTVEPLRLTGQASVCIKSTFDDFDSRIVVNSPEHVRAAIEELLRNFTQDQYRDWCATNPNNPANE